MSIPADIKMTASPESGEHKPNDRVQWLRDAAPYINAHRGRTFVIEFGGECLLGPAFYTLINDIAILKSLGIKLVLVHGARPQIEARLKQLGAKSHYADGLRITDEHALPTVKEAVGGVRLDIEAQLSLCLINTPMAGSQLRVISGNFVTAKPYGVRNGIDFCHTGEIRKIDSATLQAQLDAGHIVLLSPLGYSPTGEIFNLRAEDVATATAVALNADKLIFMLDGPGLLDKKRNQITQLTIAQAKQLLNTDKSLTEPVQHDLQSAIDACGQGVSRIHLLSHKLNGGLLQELYTRDGVGTLITTEKYETIRTADIEDIGGILALIKPLEANGTLLKRSREQLELEIDKFTVIELDGKVIGCAALYPYKDKKTGELACIVVDPNHTNNARGKELLKHIEQQAINAGLTSLFVLTTQTAHWFREQGFEPGKENQLPPVKQQLYNYQRNSKILLKRIS